MEIFGSNPEKEIKNTIEEHAISHISEKLSQKVVEEGFVQAAKEHLKKLNIKPVYTAQNQNPEKFAEMRQKLNTEAGIIISNHPGHYDFFTILNAIERNDIKILISKTGYKNFGQIIGEDFLIEAKGDGDSLSEIRSMFDSIKNHIKEGGVVLIFPTGGGDKVGLEKQDFIFKDGLSVIIKNVLKPNDMVYSFNVDPEDIQSIANEKLNRNVSSALSYAVGDSVNPNNYMETKEIHLNEAYSKADEWQHILDRTEKKERGAQITEHYYSQFDNSIEK